MWPTNGNPEIARTLPRQRGLPQRWYDSQANEIALNGIVYNDLLHEQEVEVEATDVFNALYDFCEEQEVVVRHRKLNASLGRGGTYTGADGNLCRGLTLNTEYLPSDPRTVATFVHEIVHAIGHTYKNAKGNWSFYGRTTIPSPVKEAEAYIVEFRVFSFFFPKKIIRNVNGSDYVEFDALEDFNTRLYWYGPKRNIHMIREEQCVEFADNLILYILDSLIAKGKI